MTRNRMRQRQWLDVALGSLAVTALMLCWVFYVRQLWMAACHSLLAQGGLLVGLGLIGFQFAYYILAAVVGGTLATLSVTGPAILWHRLLPTAAIPILISFLISLWQRQRQPLSPARIINDAVVLVVAIATFYALMWTWVYFLRLLRGSK